MVVYKLECVSMSIVVVEVDICIPIDVPFVNVYSNLCLWSSLGITMIIVHGVCVNLMCTSLAV